ncbi:MAG: PDZ domain-containing protein, partial [Planctomycetes bacterium]|nr:PDZ domain-containing protein [Planctomycetota bacterium]
CWLVGMLVLLALLVKRVYFVRGLIAQSKPANERLLEMLEECRCRMGICQNIELRLSGNALSPAVCGLFKPIILIPAILLKKLSPEKLKAVLVHELAHIKRGDAWVNLLQTILQIVHFYNPLVWIANAMVRRVREQAVDEMVLVTLKPDTNSYSNMLIDIAEMAFWRPKFSLRLISVVESKKALERRINHMLNRPVPKSSKLGYLGLVAIVVIGAIILPMGHNPAEQTALAASVNEERIADNKIVPGIRVGEYTFGISEDDVLESLGKPNFIFYGDKRYTLDNLPRHYYMSFDDVSFRIHDDSVKEITVLSPSYKFANGLGVGDSEQKIKQVFGDDFHIREFERKDFLNYEDKGLMFEIDKRDRTIMEINVSPIEISKSYKKADIVDKIIVPGLRVGNYTFDMSKNDVLETLGKPKRIFYGDKRYTLDNLPRQYFMHFGDVSFHIANDSVKGITALSPSYKLPNGLRVGDSEQKVKQAFGDDFKIKESKRKVYLSYKDEGLMFEIDKRDRTIMEINVSPIESSKSYKNTDIVNKIIVPGIRVGEYTFGMSKEDVFESLGKPRVIFYGDEKYTLDNLPEKYFMPYEDISFLIVNDSVKGITALSPSYKLPNGLRVGDSEQKIKKAFGNDFHIREFERKDFLNYEDEGLMFEIDRRDRTIMEINVSPIENSKSYKKAHIVDNIIIPGLRVGEYTFGMSKDDILERLGKPGVIFYGDEKYTLDNLPEKYFMPYEDISFGMHDDSVKGITALSPNYKFANGLGVGDSEQKIKKAFGDNFRIREFERKDFLSYEHIGLMFEIDKRDRTVMEINVSPIESSKSYKKGLLGLELNDKRWPLVDVVPGMPAAKAGLQNGDKILTVNDKDLTHITTIPGALEVLHGNPGEQVMLTIQRGGQILTFVVEWSK